MSECRRIVDRLASWADGALPQEERAQVDQHLAACPPCRGLATRESGGRQVLRDCAPRLREQDTQGPLPPGLRSRCEALAREHAPAPQRSWARSLVPVSIIALLLVFTAGTLFQLATRRSDALLAAQLTADHVKCFKAFDTPDAPSVDADQTEAQLAQDYGWNVQIPPGSEDHGLRLVGARRCLYADGTIPHVMYHVNGQHVSLYMLEGVTRPAADVVTLGHRSQIWSRGNTTFVLVTPESSSPADLETIANYMKAVMRDAH